MYFLGGDGRERMFLLPFSEKQRKSEGRFDDHPYLNENYKVVDSEKFQIKNIDCSLLTRTLIIEIRPYHRLSFKQKLVTRKLSTKDAVKGLPLPCMRGQLVSISSSYLFYSRQGRDSRGRSQGFASDSFK